ncbi:MAG: dTDP-6-deoxy-L-hexose 3-O-methyltransferase [Bacteroidetes bacterium GWF2_33_38]|nr:MAG: dTDP-6-deoxy-L-hexose 3-O-methyltransferase [Bacteroidetes bacterium GWF2_33_38]OFY74656.1 MAG: dTDP-6-deoxy-L-hexose 3-O-methyltransferase [Bacteroidetes bacterium RIFOXYA12_FULL_33_9]OFY91637.1 MAG: dTDP-6-deoxy-L-hexose 3-O-methyltransferase [Bacteroidetes bacterium RIFOXYA2_FULL_33_7]HBX50607.1 dTDP-6-deoxy-L-hexose 3-O-methyltransferase [Bacteroidales bacterium]
MQLFQFDTEKMWEYENGFYLTSNVSRIGKLLAHYELYKEIKELPGHILEFGVFKGASLVRFATFRELFESPYSRKIIGFDMFGQFPRQGSDADIKYANMFENNSGTGISEDELRNVFNYKKINNFELIQGDILTTLPEYLDKNPQLKISLLHIDVDIYEPTKAILELCFDRVVKNGIIAFDDYGTVEGETRATDEFFTNKCIEIKKKPFSHIPCFIKK